MKRYLEKDTLYASHRPDCFRKGQDQFNDC